MKSGRSIRSARSFLLKIDLFDAKPLDVMDVADNFLMSLLLCMRRL